MRQEFNGSVEQVAGRDIHNHAARKEYLTLDDLPSDQLISRRKVLARRLAACVRSYWFGPPTIALVVTLLLLGWYALRTLSNSRALFSAPAQQTELFPLYAGFVLVALGVFWLARHRSRRKLEHNALHEQIRAIDNVLRHRA